MSPEINDDQVVHDGAAILLKVLFLLTDSAAVAVVGGSGATCGGTLNGGFAKDFAIKSPHNAMDFSNLGEEM